MTALEVGERETYRLDAPLDLTSLWMLASMDIPALRDPRWEPRTRVRLRPEEGERLDMFSVIRDGDILVHHPYDDFTHQRRALRGAGRRGPATSWRSSRPCTAPAATRRSSRR